MTNTMSCGCGIISDNLGAYKIEYCPKHKAVDDMYEALKNICCGSIYDDCADWLQEQIDQALAKAGEKCIP